MSVDFIMHNNETAIRHDLIYVKASVRFRTRSIVRNNNRGGGELPLLAAMLIRLRFSFGSRSKVPISSRISSFPRSSADAFHHGSFVQSNENRENTEDSFPLA